MTIITGTLHQVLYMYDHIHWNLLRMIFFQAKLYRKSKHTKCEEREDQQDATIRCLLLTSVSTCFAHYYAQLQENKEPVTAFGVLLWFCWMWLVAVVGALSCRMWAPWSAFNMFRASLCPSSGEQIPFTAYGVLFWFCWMWLVAAVGRCFVGCEHTV